MPYGGALLGAVASSIRSLTGQSTGAGKQNHQHLTQGGQDHHAITSYSCPFRKKTKNRYRSPHGRCNRVFRRLRSHNRVARGRCLPERGNESSRRGKPTSASTPRGQLSPSSGSTPTTHPFPLFASLRRRAFLCHICMVSTKCCLSRRNCYQTGRNDVVGVLIVSLDR